MTLFFMTRTRTALISFLAFILLCYSDGSGKDIAWQKKPAPERQKTIAGSTTQLPVPDFQGMAVEEAIKKRRSIRSYSGKPMNMAELSGLLFSAQGITGEIHGQKLRTAPSAGALYPMELYVFVHNVSGLSQGLYHYNPLEHSLIVIKKGDLREDISKAGLGQKALKEANVVIALTAVPGRTTRKYGNRGFRYIYIEAGHIAQNMALEAVSSGLGAATIGAFLDNELNRLIGIDGKKGISLYLFTAGKIEN